MLIRQTDSANPLDLPFHEFLSGDERHAPHSPQLTLDRLFREDRLPEPLRIYLTGHLRRANRYAAWKHGDRAAWFDEQEFLEYLDTGCWPSPHSRTWSRGAQWPLPHEAPF